jgi:hypothetical protein
VNNVISQLPRILKNNGKLILVGPNYKYAYRYYFDDPTHITPLSHTTLILLCAKYGLAPYKIIPKFLPYTMQKSLGGVTPSFLEKTPGLARLILRLYLSLPYKPFAGQFLLVFHKVTQMNMEEAR